MSRAYRIKVKESLSRHVQGEDRVGTKLELLPVLSPERMRALLEAQLGARGFRVDGDVATRQAGEVTVTVNVATGEVEAVAQGHAELSLTQEQVVMAERPDAGTEAALRAKAKAALEAEAKAEEEALRRRATLALEQTVAQVRRELDEVVTRVTVDALKQRAAELGTVEKVVDEPNGGLTITVKV